MCRYNVPVKLAHVYYSDMWECSGTVSIIVTETAVTSITLTHLPSTHSDVFISGNIANSIVMRMKN